MRWDWRHPSGISAAEPCTACKIAASGPVTDVELLRLQTSSMAQSSTMHSSMATRLASAYSKA
uniref:Uncharacterized protein n=1 Tax=Rhizobium meliloti TaxID=382 RepID=A0A0D4DCY5_RHIML|nr:hypothetical protein [Sinorhizobium meliloti]